MVEVRLAALRQDLKLLPGSHDEDGAPRWLLHDRVRNRYFTLAAQALDLIRYWQPGVTPDELAKVLAAKGLEYAPEEVQAFNDFLIANNLVQARTESASRFFSQQAQNSKQSLWRWLLHNYLFIRIPLIRPGPWLDQLASKLGWLFQPAAHWAVLIMGFIGAMLVLRQWDSFTHTFLYFFSLEGLFLYGLTLVMVKSAHEMGHALVSSRLGCRVSSMGVAFLVMFPVLYTDTTDAWKLRSRRQRLRIVTAGVRTELYLALIATFMWALLPDGAVRSACFFVATTSWVTSLLVNISPFMRFDGYYALSDLLGVENLQSRAFELGRWQLRRWLWGLDDPLPEPMPRRRARLLIAYAWGTWLYRFFLFLGIALLVYHFFFKVLGILLFVVEVLWFIVMPIIKEIAVWQKRHRDFVWSWPRRLSLLGLLLLSAWIALPLSVDVHAPAVLKPQASRVLFAPEASRVDRVAVTPGTFVESGEVLVKLESPDLQQEWALTQEKMRQVETRLQRRAVSVEEKAAEAVNRKRLQQLEEKMNGLRQRRELLEIRAPFAGQVTQLETLEMGQWVGDDQPLLALVKPDAWQLEALVSEQYLELLQPGQTARFIVDSGQQEGMSAQLSQIDVSAVAGLPYPELASDYGGRIAVRRQSEQLIPEQAQYRLELEMAELPQIGAFPARTVGMVVIEAEPRSWLVYQLRRMASVLVRESGF